MKRTERVARDRARTGLAVSMTAGAMEVDAEDMAGDGRSVKVVLARQVAMYVATVSFGMSYGRVAAALGRDRSTVQHACQIVEERRDDPAFDTWVEALERALACSPVIA